MDAAARILKEEQIQLSQPDSSGLKLVWIVDDDPIMRLWNSKIVSNTFEEVQVETYTNALEVLNRLNLIPEQGVPDLLLLDLDMPEMTGLDFLERFKSIPHEIWSKVTVSVVSSSLDDENFSAVIEHPLVATLIPKPLNPANLVKLSNYYCRTFSQ